LHDRRMSIEDDIAFLETVPLFRLIGRAALRVIAMGAETLTVGSGKVLFEDPDAIDCGYVVKSGRFGLRGPGELDPDFIVGARAVLGELAMMTQTARPAPVTALEAAQVMRIPRTLFMKMLDAYPDAALRLRNHIAARAELAMSDVVKVRGAFGEPRGKS
jgi:CRP-like cAMP-binding protein